MKKLFIAIAFIVSFVFTSQAQINLSVDYRPDLTSVLRNPAMGWMMYEEGWSFDKNGVYKNNIYTPEVFWKQMEDANAAAYSNILYVRIMWKDIEPEEGKYAWIYDKKYKWYIEQAEKHHLKLAFRVFFHGGVPDYVYKAGATHTAVDDEGKIQPHYDHPVFLEKLGKFIEAFAKEYDDPDRVDYVDAYGIGRWGEGHGVTLSNPENMNNVIRTVTGMYAKHFKKVLTVINLSSHDYAFVKPEVYDKLGFLPRRDGIGSFWFSNQERWSLNHELFPNKAVIGEGCYWFNATDGDNSKYVAFKQDKRFYMNDFKDALTVAVTDALDNHSNTLDLRVPLQCKFMIEQLPEQVQRFISLGGYRLYPEYLKVASTAEGLELEHVWKNYGVGVLPNRHPNWNHKYRVGFALLDKKGNVVESVVDKDIEPADWLKGPSYNYLTKWKPTHQAEGKLTLCVGIVDTTKQNQPGIDLAVERHYKIGKWVKICEY